MRSVCEKNGDWAQLRAAALAVCLVTGSLSCLLAAGCPGVPADSNSNGSTNQNDNGTSTGEDRIVSPQSNFAISALGRPVSIIYSVFGQPTRIDGFRQRVGEAELVIIAPDLNPGTNRQFQFDPREAGVGSFRAGINVTRGSTTTTLFAAGIIQVQGPPNPRFILPTQELNIVNPGTDVLLTFDAGDPEGIAQWRLFFYRDDLELDQRPDQIGTQLATGVGNVGSFTFSTTGLAPGDYKIGLSATDTGSSIAATVASGQEDRLVTIPDETTPGRVIRVVEEADDALPPTLTFTVPATEGVLLFQNETFNMEFTANIREPGATGTIDLFHDTDRNPNNGFTLLDSDLPATTTSYPFPTNLPDGTYNVGGSVSDGANPTVFAYAPGTVTVIRTPTLTVTAPDTTLPIAPTTPAGGGGTATVRWATNVPSSAGNVDVFALRLDENGDPINEDNELVILPSSPTTVTTATFSSATPGLYRITVRIVFNPDVGLGPLTANAPTPVRVSGLPGVLWLGDLASANPRFGGAIFGGVNFEDNAGTAFSTAGDLNGDGLDEFIITARYGKPFFVNPTGVGPGEAYVIYGASGSNRITGVKNLNSVGTAGLRGVTMAGVRTPQNSNATDGLSSVTFVPDVDGDRRNELVFGFPDTNSRGHNVDTRQNGVVDPRSLATLEREGQFLRGGIVVVSSQNSVLGNPMSGSPVINLDLVGQDFESTCVGPEPDGLGMITEDFGAANFSIDVLNPDSDPPCAGSCEDPSGGGVPDGNMTIDYGFVRALARDYFFSYVYSFDIYFGLNRCPSIDDFVPIDCVPLQYCQPFPAGCEPFSPGLHSQVDLEIETVPGAPGFLLPVFSRRSGYYETFITFFDSNNNEVVFANEPLEPFGARIIGVGLGDKFGTSVTLIASGSGGVHDVIVSAPNRTARGILFGPQPAGCEDPPSCGGEINGLEQSAGVAKVNEDSGVGYLFRARTLWSHLGAGPKPHQYIVGEASHCGGPGGSIPNIDAIRIAGFEGDRITNIIGIDDFNGDGRDDFAIGAPEAIGGSGRIYIGFRRDPAIEGDYVLEKLALSPTSPNRLDGALILGNEGSGLGSSLTSVDFNGDGIPDLVAGSPNADNGVGEVIVIFADPGLRTPENGSTIQSLLTTTTALGQPRAARITGNLLDANGNFGFNVANAGDVDGDGKDDLLVAAPNASPRFDPDITDDVDALTEPGLDLDLDGVQDDVSGPAFLPDGAITEADDLINAGIVYVISSRTRLDQLSSDDNTISIAELGGGEIFGFLIVGRHAGDRIGGGDAGDPAMGGNEVKDGRGRSFGLAAAGDVDGDNRADILIGSILADPRRDPTSGVGVINGGEAYLVYGSAAP